MRPPSSQALRILPSLPSLPPPPPPPPSQPQLLPLPSPPPPPSLLPTASSASVVKKPTRLLPPCHPSLHGQPGPRQRLQQEHDSARMGEGDRGGFCPALFGTRLGAEGRKGGRGISDFTVTPMPSREMERRHRVHSHAWSKGTARWGMGEEKRPKAGSSIPAHSCFFGRSLWQIVFQTATHRLRGNDNGSKPAKAPTQCTDSHGYVIWGSYFHQLHITMWLYILSFY